MGFLYNVLLHSLSCTVESLKCTVAVLYNVLWQFFKMSLDKLYCHKFLVPEQADEQTV